MTAVTIQSNKIVSNEVKDNSVLLELSYGKTEQTFRPTQYIPFHVYTTFCLFIHQLMDTGCFPVLATVNNAAMNIGVQVPKSLLSILWVNT